jgi:hypothetical protein
MSNKTAQAINQEIAQESISTMRRGKIATAKDTFAFLNTALPVIGAVETVLVWSAANFYVGKVEIIPTKEVKNISISVYDKKGEHGTFHTPQFELMPGNYRLEIATDSGSKYIADAKVVFHQKTIVNVPDSIPTNLVGEEPKKQKHWWQFWRHGS